MSDEVQPGTKVDADLWRAFREEVNRRRGGTRGHLRNELEQALRAYIQAGDATPADIDARLQRIEAAVGAAPTDGGATVSDAEDTHTHRHRDPPRHDSIDERPHVKASRDDKVAWLVGCVIDEFTADFAQISKSSLRDIVKDEYGFRSDTAQEYVDELIDHFELVTHPQHDALLVSNDKRRSIIAQDADETLDT